ncbi:MAG: uroporphyrinogen-III C-methyltransferase [Burkholderiaceae bacterium]|nr:uroporphyrinogen-III C-methyltransferase [Burkholderiaceae bacterium]
MSEPDKVVPEGAPRSAAPLPEPTHRPALARAAGWGGWVAWAALALAIASALWTGSRLGLLESEATRRLQAGDQRIAQLEASLGHAQAQLRDALSRTAVLESKVLETAGLQAQLEKLYRSLANDSTDVLLAEIESALALASQQLALGSNPQAALGALQEIEARLRRQDDPSLGAVRRALQRDIDRLKAYPAADIVSLAMRLDGLLASIDQYPLIASVRMPGAQAPEAGPAGRSAARGGSSDADVRRPASVGEATSRATDAAAAGLSALRDELQQLFRVRRVDTPDAALVAPEQAYFLRQNLRLLLLNARLALLSRNESLFRSDVERAVGWLRSYYDPDNRGVSSATAQLRQLLGARIALEPPTLAESLAAVRAARAAREAGR